MHKHTDFGIYAWEMDPQISTYMIQIRNKLSFLTVLTHTCV